MGFRDHALRHVAAELTAAFVHIDDLRTVLDRSIWLALLCQFIGNGDVETMNERSKRIVGELLFLVSGVPCLAGSQAKAFDRMGQDHGRTATVFRGAFI